MGHGHGHGNHGVVEVGQRARTILIGFLAVVAAFAVAGLIWLWPSGAELDQALNRVVDVTYRRRPGDLGFGSGTLLLTTVAGHLLRLDNLPRIKDMHQAVSELVADVAPRTEPEEPWR